MTSPIALLFLAQMMIARDDPAGSAPSVQPLPPHAGPGHHALSGARATPTPSPGTCIRIINATSVPEISLSVSGTNGPVAYPDFKQGTWTGNAPLGRTAFHYLVRSASGEFVADHVTNFPALASGTLLLTGDLSTGGPAEKLPEIAPNAARLRESLSPDGSHAPNFQFRFFPSTTTTADPCHYRIVNGMPSKSLTLRGKPDGQRPARQLALLAPGESVLFVHQPPDVTWEAEIDGVVYPVEILQRDTPLNCIIPFFLRQGRPEFIRVFESP